MCGISGIFSLYENKNDLINLTQSMNRALSHRGPDDDRIWYEDDLSCALAHRRLSIIDLSPRGAQPMISQSTRFVICYNGEVYNTEELKKLLQNNIKTKGHSDTELILELCEIYGIKKVIQKLIGMFAFALYDRKEEKIYLCRDRLGIKPIYWTLINNNEFVFSSELKPLILHPQIPKK